MDIDSALIPERASRAMLRASRAPPETGKKGRIPGSKSRERYDGIMPPKPPRPPNPGPARELPVNNSRMTFAWMIRAATNDRQELIDLVLGIARGETKLLVGDMVFYPTIAERFTALVYLIDRVEGKMQQGVKLSGDVENPVAIAAVDARAVDAKQLTDAQVKVLLDVSQHVLPPASQSTVDGQLATGSPTQP